MWRRSIKLHFVYNVSSLIQSASIFLNFCASTLVLEVKIILRISSHLISSSFIDFKFFLRFPKSFLSDSTSASTVCLIGEFCITSISESFSSIVLINDFILEMTPYSMSYIFLGLSLVIFN
eukprot:NODE_73_length_24441_cov_0.672952.p20 type:complete len:121 gc:universal NODE_73_length_24441_cov_0.672952:2850-3212(+)